MKQAAMIALILAGMSMVLGMLQYGSHLLGMYGPNITRVTWPLSIILHGLPIIILCLAILMKPDSKPGDRDSMPSRDTEEY